MKNITSIFLVVISLSSCVDRYWPNIDSYENLLVVDGTLTDGDDPVIVKLSFSNSINSDELLPVMDAEVYITEDNATTILLSETRAGVYQIMDSTYCGKVGSSYRLYIQLVSGKKYESNSCLMMPPSPIDSVYAILETKQYVENKKDKYGYQFYLDNHSDSDSTRYYLWRLSQTYEYKTTFNIHFTWEGELIPYPDPDSLRRCWRTQQITNFFTYSTLYLKPPIINGFPLNFTSTKNKMLSIRYSLLVNQLSITKEAFGFWDALQQQNIDQGNLYSQQPNQIVGNVHNILNFEEFVLGYFTVASVTKKRIFVNRPSIVPFYYEECEPDLEIMGVIRFEPPESWPIYLTLIPDKDLAGATMEFCFDCRIGGGSITPPDFWEKRLTEK